MKKHVSILFVMLFLISTFVAINGIQTTAGSPINLKPQEEEWQTDNLTLIVYPDQTVELRMLHEEAPAPDNATVNMAFEFTKENETYIGSASGTMTPPEDELGPFEPIDSISINGSYIDGQLRGTGAVHFIEGVPLTTILINFNISQTEQTFRIELEDALLPLPIKNTMQPLPPIAMPPDVFIEFIENVTNMLNFLVENCTVEIVENETTSTMAFAKVSVETEEDFILGEFTGTTNVTAFFNASNYLQNLTIKGLWEGQGNAKLQFEIFAELTNGAPSKVTLDILLTDSADKWALTADGEFTFANKPFFAITAIDFTVSLEGNATEALSDLENILMNAVKLAPPEEEVPPIEEIFEFQRDISKALSAIEIEELSFNFGYANGQLSFDSDFELSGNLDDALAEAKDIWFDFIAEIDPNVTEDMWYQFLDKTNLKPEYIKLEMQQTTTKLTGIIVLKKIETEVAGNATVFRYPLLFDVLNESEYAGTATLKIVGGENETHQVFLDIPADVPKPIEQTDRYAIWNITGDFNIAELGKVKFLSIQVVYPIVVGEQEVEIEVVANVTGVTVTDVSYESSFTTLGTSKGFKFVVSGPSGTVAAVNITIPKDAVPSGVQPTVYVNGEPVPATIFETETDYIIMITVHFSEVIIYVEFTTPIERYLFAIIGGVVVLLLIIVAASTLLKKKK